MLRLMFLVALALSTTAQAAPRMIGELPRKTTVFEEIAGVESEYGVVQTRDGARLRTIVTRPAGSSGRLPAIYYVQPLSCDTVEAVEAGGWSEMLKRVAAESGRVFIRVDKAGVGDSQGPTCRALGYEMEIDHHAQAVEQLARHPWVDGDKMVLYGASMGARMVPALAAKRPYQGVVVWGGGGATWFQRQVAFQRRAHSARGLAGLASKSNQADAIYASWLLEGRRPDPSSDAWKALTATHADGQFGRSFAWHEEAQKQDVLGQWAQVKPPVLVMLGDQDWFEEPEGAQLIGQAVREGGGRADVVIVPGMDHHFTLYPDRKGSLTGQGGKVDDRPMTGPMLAWIRGLG